MWCRVADKAKVLVCRKFVESHDYGTTHVRPEKILIYSLHKPLTYPLLGASAAGPDLPPYLDELPVNTNYSVEVIENLAFDNMRPVVCCVNKAANLCSPIELQERYAKARAPPDMSLRDLLVRVVELLAGTREAAEAELKPKHSQCSVRQLQSLGRFNKVYFGSICDISLFYYLDRTPLCSWNRWLMLWPWRSTR